ncbi:tyrosine-type recombinase/integrase [Ilumatobacter sp.]|uniref:tyrosine-type recombinase/integrase n=1 Tax=Ilumatobacter sp. TaxID=1967498 RepID=UPI003C40DCC2
MAGQDSLRTRTLRRNGHVGSVASDTVRRAAADRSSTAVDFSKYPTARGCSLKVDSSTRNERARPRQQDRHHPPVAENCTGPRSLHRRTRIGPNLHEPRRNQSTRSTRVVRRLTKAAGIAKRISPHSLRHRSITAALDAGVPLRDVQEAASHSDPRTSMRYDRGRVSLDRHATYIVSAFVAGASR